MKAGRSVPIASFPRSPPARKAIGSGPSGGTEQHAPRIPSREDPWRGRRIVSDNARPAHGPELDSSDLTDRSLPSRAARRWHGQRHQAAGAGASPATLRCPSVRRAGIPLKSGRAGRSFILVIPGAAPAVMIAAEACRVPRAGGPRRELRRPRGSAHRTVRDGRTTRMPR